MAKLRLRVQELAEAKGIHKAHTLQLEMGITPAKAARVWKGEMSKIELDTILELCDFFKCSPTDLFARDDNKKWPNYRKR